MRTYYFTVFFVFIMLWFSCSKPIDIDIEEADKVLVLNGILNPDSTIRIHLSKSFGILELESAAEFIRDAEVDLYENNERVAGLEHTNNGVYVTDFYPQAGRDYTIRASIPDLPAVEADITIPFPVSLTALDADFDYITVTEQWWNPETQQYFDTTIQRISDEGLINISFTDPADSDNYYFITIFNERPVFNWEEEPPVLIGYTRYPVYYENNLLSYENHIYLNNLSGYVISDDYFNGQEYTFSAQVYAWDFIDGYYEFDDYYNISPVIVNLHSVPKAFFDFVISLSKYDDALYNPFVEPVNVAVNVENGFGFLTGYSTASDTLFFE